MPTANYYRMKAKECFDRALSAKRSSEVKKWQQRGHEYSEMALAIDAERGASSGPSHKLTKEE